MRAVYVAPSEAEDRAAELGLSLIVDGDAEPHAYLQGGGLTFALPEPIDPDEVSARMIEIQALEDAADAGEQTRVANRQTLWDRSQQALASNDAFLALSAPTNAQTVAQVQRLTKECTALIRLTLGLFDSTAGS